MIWESSQRLDVPGGKHRMWLKACVTGCVPRIRQHVGVCQKTALAIVYVSQTSLYEGPDNSRSVIRQIATETVVTVEKLDSRVAEPLPSRGHASDRLFAQDWQ